MHELVNTALRVARSDAPVLVTGASGVGKELLAEILHANSRRAHRPLVRVNAGAIPEALIESELFGVESGAFTGAARSRPGLFARARGGTLFLDEIANLSLAGQAKLLRVLQGGDYQPLGGGAPQRADVRLVAATNADLAAAVDVGAFREDLYYRLDVVRLRVPSLAERKEDILPIAEGLLASSHDEGPRALSEAARSALVAHDWPGNVRELQNRLIRAQLLADDARIEPRDLGLADGNSTVTPLRLALVRAPASTPAPETRGLVRSVLETSLRRAAGNVTQAAAELGVSRQSLYRAMQRLGVRRRSTWDARA